MNLQPSIVDISVKIIAGIKMEMTLSENRTGELWQKFMPLKNTIPHSVGLDLVSMANYPSDFFSAFNPTALFTKIAGVEVSQTNMENMRYECFEIPAGQYAMFLYKGLNTDPSIFQYIFNDWIPKSDYVVAHRPHFEILGKGYKNNDPNSEEEIWIPIERRNKTNI